jgi:hypothetical protein
MIEILHHGVAVERIAMSTSGFVGKKFGERIATWVVAGMKHRGFDLLIDVLTLKEYAEQQEDKMFSRC